MFINFYDDQRKLETLVNLNEAQVLTYKDRVLSVNKGNPSTRYEDTDEGIAAGKVRYNDIVSALNSEKVIVYDMTKPVGYWKPKHPSKTKAAAKTAPNPVDK